MEAIVAKPIEDAFGEVMTNVVAVADLARSMEPEPVEGAPAKPRRLPSLAALRTERGAAEGGDGEGGDGEARSAS